MKVILTQFVRGLGEKGDIVDVSDGYATNALFPKKLAKPATKDLINKQKMAEKSAKIREEKEKDTLLRIFEQLRDKKIEIEERANEKGKLYHALGNRDIVKILREEEGIEISEKVFTQKNTIKNLGEYSIELSAFGKVVSFILSVREV